MNFRKSLFGTLSRDILFLYLNRIIVQIAFGFIAGFGTIFFYEKFDGSIVKVLILFSILHLVFAVSNHISAKFIKTFGMKKMMIISLASLSIMFISRIFWDYSIWISLFVYFASFTIYKAFYWIPYHVEFASFTDKRNRGKQTAVLYNFGDIFSATLPFFAGFILSLFGYNTLFILGFIFVILSIYPLIKIKETHEEYSWNLKRLFNELFEKENRPIVISSLGNGMQTAVAATVWPMFVFIYTDGSYTQFGLVLSVVAVTLIILRYIVGKYLDKVGREKVLKVGNFIYFTGWIFKMFIQSISGIFISDIYHRFGSMVNKTSFDVTAYDQAADNGHYIDEYTVVKEFTHLFGRALMCAILIPVVIVWGIKVSFLFGALATLSMVLINRQLLVK